MSNVKVAIIQGNGGLTSADLWYPETKREIEQIGIEIIEPVPAYVVDYMPKCMQYMKDVMKIGKDTIIVGHSSGAVAAMRYAEKYPIFGSVLVSVSHTDLGIASEADSEYFAEPLDWNSIQANQNWIVQFAAGNDPWIPVEEPRFVRDHLDTNYYEKPKGHYQEIIFPEVTEVIKAKLGI